MVFQIDRQTDREEGCIPASAVSVLKHLGLTSAPSEQKLIDAVKSSGAASGFKRLKEALASTCNVLIQEKLNGQALVASLTTHTLQGHLVLVALSAPASGGRAHCVVVEAVRNGDVHFQDPWEGTRHQEAEAQFSGRAAGDIAVLSL